MHKDTLVEFIKEHFAEMLGGLSIITLIALLLPMKRQYIVTFLGCVSIAAVSFEKRAQVFDRIVSILVILMLAIGFMLFE